MKSDVEGLSSARRMLAALEAREISAVELVELHASRIAKYNGLLNAIVTLDLERARQDARAADRSRASGDARPLLGLPFTVKDNLDIAGLRTTSGIPERAKGGAAAVDATSIGRLRAAGAIALGKTNLPIRASDYQTTNEIFGRTVNPHDRSRTPGGSTGGGAAAVAAGLSPLDIGTDIGGSIRVPAAFCGIFGHKPSETLIPRDGQIPDFPVSNPAKLCNVHGPLARDPADLEVAVRVMAGPAAGEESAWRLELPHPRHERLADHRVAILPPIAWLAVASDIAGAIERLAGVLERSGARCIRAQPESFGDLKEHYRRYLGVIGGTLGASWPAELVERIASAPRPSVPDEFAPGIFGGARASVREYLTWVDDREQHRSSYRDFFRAHDILIAPMAPVTAFPHDDRPHHLRSITPDGIDIPYGRLSVYPSIATLSGQPATVVPIGRDRDGLPIAVQVIGPYLEDLTTLRFAALVAREVGGYQPPRGYE